MLPCASFSLAHIVDEDPSAGTGLRPLRWNGLVIEGFELDLVNCLRLGLWNPLGREGLLSL